MESFYAALTAPAINTRETHLTPTLSSSIKNLTAIQVNSFTTINVSVHRATNSVKPSDPPTEVTDIGLPAAGIGTYVAGEESINLGLWGRLKKWCTETMDLGLGTSFDQHVIAGYRFIMRYHDAHDKIFIFGFSRGAFTARFLARMISTVGLLSKGNEEMVPFAYRTYQEYEMGIGRFKTAQKHEDYMMSFKTTFCRVNAKVHFLGLFDTVSSVGYFDAPFAKKTFLPTVVESATHVR